MTRLAHLRIHLSYPEDVKLICREVSEINSYQEAQFLWREFSADVYSAGWMTVHEFFLKQFQEWLMEEINDSRD